MSISRQEVETIAQLARLQISESQWSNVETSLSSILQLAEELQSVTTEVAPLSNPLDSQALLRPDEVTETNHRDDYQQLAPQIQDGLFLVPQVIE